MLPLSMIMELLQQCGIFGFHLIEIKITICHVQNFWPKVK